MVEPKFGPFVCKLNRMIEKTPQRRYATCHRLKREIPKNVKIELFRLIYFFARVFQRHRKHLKYWKQINLFMQIRLLKATTPVGRTQIPKSRMRLDIGVIDDFKVLITDESLDLISEEERCQAIIDWHQQGGARSNVDEFHQLMDCIDWTLIPEQSVLNLAPMRVARFYIAMCE